MSPNYPARLNNELLIAGLFREALFFRRQIRIEANECYFEAVVQQVIEPSARKKGALRTLILKTIGKPSLIPGSDFSFRCHFPNFIASWSSRVDHSGQYLQSPIPKELSLENQRTLRRLSVDHIRKLETPVLIFSTDTHSEGIFQVEDSSAGGIGGKLYLPREVPITANTRISGIAQTGDAHLRIEGTVVHATFLEETEHNLGIYRVGITTHKERNSQHREFDRRQFSRNESKNILKGHSPLSPNYPIKLRVKDVSVAGFSATLDNTQDTHLLPINCAVTLPEFDLAAEVVGFESDTLRFQIVKGTVSARLEWLKSISKSLNAEAETSSPLSHALIDLFCEAGAVSSAFLEAQSPRAAALIEGMGIDSAHASWLHRWIEQTPSGQVRGHISAIRFSDNVWYLADLAGSPDQEKRISPQFISKFFVSFMEFALGCSPCPQLLLCWNEGHPFWAELQRHFEGLSEELLLASPRTSYYRFTGRVMLEQSANLVSPIASSDYKKIRQIRDSAGTSKSFLSALDFKIDNFGSPALTESVRASENHFKRAYFTLECKEGTWLIVFSQYPAGVSINRTPDVAWIIPIGQNHSVTLSQASLNAIRSQALKLGISPPGVLQILPETSLSTSGTKGMRWWLVHPSALNWYKR